MRSNYWNHRLIENQYEYNSKGMEKQLLKIYKSTSESIIREVKALWLDLLDDGEISSAALFRKDRYSKIYRRLSQLISSLSNKEIEILSEGLLKGYEEMTKDLEGIREGDILFVNTQAAEEVVNANFKGSKYSDRIWLRQTELKNQLSEVITRSAVIGEDWKKVSEDLKERMEVSRSDSVRLIRTETMRVLNDACINSAARKGFKSYHILVENDACDECLKLKGKHFLLSEKLLPVHPHCRCCVVIDLDENTEK